MTAVVIVGFFVPVWPAIVGSTATLGAFVAWTFWVLRAPLSETHLIRWRDAGFDNMCEYARRCCDGLVFIPMMVMYSLCQVIVTRKAGAAWGAVSWMLYAVHVVLGLLWMFKVVYCPSEGTGCAGCPNVRHAGLGSRTMYWLLGVLFIFPWFLLSFV
jgi:hypothetical protein